MREVFLLFFLFLPFSAAVYADDSTSVRPKIMNTAKLLTVNILHVDPNPYPWNSAVPVCSASGKVINSEIYSIYNSGNTGVFPQTAVFTYTCQENIWDNDPFYTTLKNSAWIPQQSSSLYCGPSQYPGYCSMLNSKPPIISFRVTAPSVMNFTGSASTWQVWPYSALSSWLTAAVFLNGAMIYNRSFDLKSGLPTFSYWLDSWPPTTYFTAGWVQNSFYMQQIYQGTDQTYQLYASWPKVYCTTDTNASLVPSMFGKTCWVNCNGIPTWNNRDWGLGNLQLNCE